MKRKLLFLLVFFMAVELGFGAPALMIGFAYWVISTLRGLDFNQEKNVTNQTYLTPFNSMFRFLK